MPSFMRKLKEFWTPPAEDFADEYDQEEPDFGNVESNGRRAHRLNNDSASCDVRSKKVVNINATARLQVVICRPLHFAEEIRSVADELLQSHTVVLNLEETDKEAYRRIIDFLSGVAYAKGGKIKRIATNTYIVTPCNVDLTGEDLVDELESNGVYF